MLTARWFLVPLVILCSLEIAHAAAMGALSRVKSDTRGVSVPLARRSRRQGDAPDVGLWLKTSKVTLEGKYGKGSASDVGRRASGGILLTNQNADSSYFGYISVGTPAISFDVVLDTGSADLWLASGADTVPVGTPVFDASRSSSYTPLNTSFSISYGSGSAEGVLGQDVVQFSSFEIQNQVFGVVSEVTDHLLSGSLSGVFGLGFQSISASGTKPLWQSLVDQPGALSEPVMTFHLTRYINGTQVRSVEPGGSFTLGTINHSLYTGAIDYQNITGNPSYWNLDIASISIEGVSLDLSSARTVAAIDTGTTLVGGPPDVIAQLYANIPGSSPGTGNLTGYFTYPCDAEISIAMSFGENGPMWPISPTDFQLVQLYGNTCVGAFFQMQSLGSDPYPSWVIGDTFLKNVYSVFRASDPPAIGFAQLSDAALAQNGLNSSVPTPTLILPKTTITASPAISVARHLRLDIALLISLCVLVLTYLSS